jgi:hypothetical protein
MARAPQAVQNTATVTVVLNESKETVSARDPMGPGLSYGYSPEEKIHHHLYQYQYWLVCQTCDPVRQTSQHRHPCKVPDRLRRDAAL